MVGLQVQQGEGKEGVGVYKAGRITNLQLVVGSVVGRANGGTGLQSLHLSVPIAALLVPLGGGVDMGAGIAKRALFPQRDGVA